MTQSTGMGVVFEDELPLTYGCLSNALLPAERLRIESSNVELLRTLASLEDSMLERNADDVRDNDLQRLELKVNLLLDLMARLLSLQTALPPSRKLRLTATGIEFDFNHDLIVGNEVRVEVFVHPKLPRPLVLIGRVTELHNDRAQCSVAFEGAALAFQDVLDKFIFRQHRRMVAIQRRAVTSSSK